MKFIQQKIIMPIWTSLFFIFFIIISSLQAQVVFWSEDFGTGCNQGNLATTFGWTVTATGVNVSTGNSWYVSATERGVGAGNCGAPCNGTDERTLHLGSNAIPLLGFPADPGAAYYGGGLCGLAICAETHKRVESPTIDCSGKAGITLRFLYIEGGTGALDNATLMYFDGTNWTQLADPGKTATCGGVQGLWAAFSIAMPASADNNANVKIGFNWENDEFDAGATDPSFAVDSISLDAPVVAVATYTQFEARQLDEQVRIKWATASESNNDYFAIEKSLNNVDFQPIGRVKGAGSSSEKHSYTFDDLSVENGRIYYRLKQIDFDGKYEYSHTVTLLFQDKNAIQIYPNPASDVIFVEGENINENKLRVFDAMGKNLTNRIVIEKLNDSKIQLDLSKITKRIYFIKINNSTYKISKK